MTSMSSITSVSGPFGSPVGELPAPSTEMESTLGAGIPSFEKYAWRSPVVNPPPSSIMASDCPLPSRSGGKP